MLKRHIYAIPPIFSPCYHIDAAADARCFRVDFDATLRHATNEY